MSPSDFDDEDAAAFDPNFMAHPHVPQDIEAAEANRIRIAARVRVLHTHGHGHPVQTKRGPGRLDRVSRDGTAYVWFGRTMPDVYWSRTIEAENQRISADWHERVKQRAAAIERGESADPIPPIVFKQCRVPKAEVVLVDDGATGPCGRSILSGVRCNLLAKDHDPAPSFEMCQGFQPVPSFTRASDPGEDIVLVPSNGMRIGSGDVSQGQTGIDALHVDEVDVDAEHCAEMEKQVREREEWIAAKKAMKKR
jgi:hypothetical protein